MSQVSAIVWYRHLRNFRQTELQLRFFNCHVWCVIFSLSGWYYDKSRRPPSNRSFHVIKIVDLDITWGASFSCFVLYKASAVWLICTTWKVEEVWKTLIIRVSMDLYVHYCTVEVLLLELTRTYDCSDKGVFG